MSFLLGLVFVVWGAVAVAAVYFPKVCNLVNTRAASWSWMLVAPAASWCALAVGIFIWMPPSLKWDIFAAVVGTAIVLVLNAVRRGGAVRK